MVDDNRDAAESLALLLKIDGHQVCIAYDGPSAVEMAQAERPDVVLLDIGLPGMDGYAVARTLQQSAELERTLLIALTGYGHSRRTGKSHAPPASTSTWSNPSISKRCKSCWPNA